MDRDDRAHVQAARGREVAREEAAGRSRPAADPGVRGPRRGERPERAPARARGARGGRARHRREPRGLAPRRAPRAHRRERRGAPAAREPVHREPPAAAARRAGPRRAQRGPGRRARRAPLRERRRARRARAGARGLAQRLRRRARRLDAGRSQAAGRAARALPQGAARGPHRRDRLVGAATPRRHRRGSSRPCGVGRGAGARTLRVRSRGVPMSDATPTIARPRTSTRDRGELRERLERWLARRFGDAEVSPLAGPTTNGMSSETLLFDASWREGGVRKSAVARRPRGARPGRRARLPDLRHGAPVPRDAHARTSSARCRCRACSGARRIRRRSARRSS